MYTVTKRFGDENLDIREFIRPNTFMVAELVQRYRFRTPEDAWRWVTANISYPYGPADIQDHHTLLQFWKPGLKEPNRVYTTDDYWELPSEVLRDRMADCEGSTFLLVSIMRRLWPELMAYATIGYYENYGHVWTSIYRNNTWYVMETTISQAPQIVPIERLPYKPYFRFNETELLINRWEVPSRVRNQEKTRRINMAYNVG